MKPPKTTRKSRMRVDTSRSDIHVAIEHGPHRGLARTEIVRRTDAIVKALQLKNMEFSIVLTDDKTIHNLNKVYRNKDSATDVLAFAMQEGELAHLAGGILGDVIVSVETARKQADERGATLLDEVTMLIAHGLLHLLGWDHDTVAKDRLMTAETRRLVLAAARTSHAPNKKEQPAPRKRTSKAGSKSLSKRPRRHSKA